LFATQIPDCLRDSAGDEPTVRQDNLLESFEDLPEPHILPEHDFQIVLRFQSHHEAIYILLDNLDILYQNRRRAEGRI